MDGSPPKKKEKIKKSGLTDFRCQESVGLEGVLGITAIAYIKDESFP